MLQLEEIGHSAFITTSHASFKSLQQTWRVEIESCFAELRVRDDVRRRPRKPFKAYCCHMGTAIKHPVPDRVKPSFVIFDILTL